MSLAEGIVPAGWPVVAPASRSLRWIGAALVVLMLAVAVVSVFVLRRLNQPPAWRPVFAGVGLILVVGCAGYGAWALWRGTPMRIVRHSALPARMTASDRRRIRRALLSGAALADGDDRRAAALVAGLVVMRPILILMTATIGYSVLSLSTTAAEELPFMLPLAGVGVAALLVLYGAALWSWRIRRPAEAIGAVPVRVPG